jgi:hypothetical protein
MKMRIGSLLVVGVAVAICVVFMLSVRNASVEAANDSVAAQSQQAVGLKLFQTSINTQNDLLPLISNVFEQAFLPTAVHCPMIATNGCTLRIDVSCVFEDTGYPPSETINVSVTGASLPPVDPDASVSVDGVPQINFDARSFQWVQRSVPAGATATVSVQVEGNGSAFDRTETIDVFRN